MKDYRIQKEKRNLLYTEQACILELINWLEKRLELQLQPKQKQALKIKAREAINAFANNGYSVKEKPTITTYKELVALWWDSYKNTIKPNSQQSMEGIVRLHILPVFGDYKLDKLTTPIIQQQVNKWADKANKGEKRGICKL